MARDDEEGAEQDGLLMDDLNANKEMNGIHKPSPLATVTNTITNTIKQVTRIITRARPTSSSTASSTTASIPNTIRVIFNYPDDNFELRKTSWLDGLRGIAAFEVFVFHYLDKWMDKGMAWGEGRYRSDSWFRLPFFRTFYASGDTAVCVFFAISGYVLTHRMLSLIRLRRHEELYNSLSSAVFRRGIRLYMPVAIETFSLMIGGRYFGLPKPANWEPEPNIFLEIKRWFIQLMHLFIPLRYPDRWDEILNLYDGTISWTIPLEYYGSLVVYTILLLFARTSSMTVRLSILAGLVVSSALKDDWIAGQFLLGMAFADYQLEVAYNPGKPSQVVATARKIFFWAVFIFGFYLAGLPGGHYINEQQKYRLWSRPYYDWITQPLAAIGMYADRQVDRYIECFAGICLVVGLGETAYLRRFTEMRFVQYLGKISFGLYLCHIFVHTWLTPFDSFWFSFMGLDPTLGAHERTASLKLLLSYILMMIPATIVNFFVAGLFERYLDKPSIKAARAFENWCLSKGKAEQPNVDTRTPASAPS